jgi:hypothetical protein
MKSLNGALLVFVVQCEILCCGKPFPPEVVQPGRRLFSTLRTLS